MWNGDIINSAKLPIDLFFSLKFQAEIEILVPCHEDMEKFTENSFLKL